MSTTAPMKGGSGGEGGDDGGGTTVVVVVCTVVGALLVAGCCAVAVVFSRAGAEAGEEGAPGKAFVNPLYDDVQTDAPPAAGLGNHDQDPSLHDNVYAGHDASPEVPAGGDGAGQRYEGHDAVGTYQGLKGSDGAHATYQDVAAQDEDLDEDGYTVPTTTCA